MSTAIITHRFEMHSAANAASKAPASFWFLLAVLGQFAVAFTIALFYGLTALKVDPQVWTQDLPKRLAAANTVGDPVLAGLILLATLMSVAGALQLIAPMSDAP